MHRWQRSTGMIAVWLPSTTSTFFSWNPSLYTNIFYSILYYSPIYNTVLEALLHF